MVHYDGPERRNAERIVALEVKVEAAMGTLTTIAKQLESIEGKLDRHDSYVESELKKREGRARLVEQVKGWAVIAVLSWCAMQLGSFGVWAYETAHRLFDPKP